MPFRPSRSFVICLIALSAVGATGVWAWNRAHSVPGYQRAKLGFFRSLFWEKPLEGNFPTDEDRARNRVATEALIGKLRDEYPTLKIEDHPVPEAENGFLQLYQFGKDFLAAKSPTAQEVQRFLESDHWDPVEAERLLSQHADWVTRIEAIAALDQRSTANMPDDYHAFLEARATKFAADVLTLKAYLAAEAHDEPEAQRFTKAALNIASHYREVEAPVLLGETVAILIDLTVGQATFQHVLPALGREANLIQWKEILSSGAYSTTDFARVMRGEWENTMRYFVLPVLVDRTSRNRPKDADQLARVMASHYSSFVTRLPQRTLATMSQGPPLAAPDDLKNFSTKGRQIYEAIMVGSRNWGKGYVRAAVIVAQRQAALDLLIMERQGARLNPGSTSKVSRDPVAEKPFVFDPVARTLATSEKSEVKPLKLPF